VLRQQRRKKLRRARKVTKTGRRKGEMTELWVDVAIAESLRSAAGNVCGGANPGYQVSDFIAMYPQFGPSQNGTRPIPEAIIQVYVNLATASLQEARWLDAWPVGMGLFIAHYCTLYLQSLAAGAASSAEQIVGSAAALGPRSSQSAGDVSASYSELQALSSWGAWNLTIYGQQFATLAKVIGAGEMLIW